MSGRMKNGLDYSSWDCDLFRDDDIKALLAAHGSRGFFVYFWLCQKAYRENGYFATWCCDISSTVSYDMGGIVGASAIQEIVVYCIRHGLFDQSKYDTWKILTSKRIQQTYLNVLKRRRVRQVISEYWLLTNAECKDVEGLVKVTLKNDMSQANEHLSQANEHLSQEEHIKVKDSKSNIKLHCASGDALFEELWSMYPNKKGKARVSDKDKKIISDLGKEVMVKCLERYEQDLKRTPWKHAQNGSTFFHSGYVDYLDENYSPAPAENVSTTSKFNNFESRKTDYNSIAAQLIN